MARHDEKLNKGKIRLTSLISFLAGLAQALFSYIMSSYLKLSSGTENVGIFYLISYLIIFIVLLNLHKIVKKYGKSNAYFTALFLKMFSIIGLLFAPLGITSIVLVVIYIIMGNIQWVGMDMILESYSSDRMSGRIRGKFLTIMNAGVLLGPFLSTSILERFDFYGIFLSILIFNTAILFISVLGFRRVNHHYDGQMSVRVILKKIVQRKNIRRAFHISFVLEFFYALMVIYTPIYLLNIGMSWKEIGIIFTWMLIPFVILQYPVGYLADKKMGEKEMLIFSVFVMGTSTLAAYFITSPSVFIWSVVLFATRIGAALVEILRDSYFYKRIDGHDVDLIDIFRSAKPVAYTIAAAVSAILLLLFPMKYIFILVGTVVLSALWPAIRLADNKSECEAR